MSLVFAFCNCCINAEILGRSVTLRPGSLNRLPQVMQTLCERLDRGQVNERSLSCFCAASTVAFERKLTCDSAINRETDRQTETDRQRQTQTDRHRQTQRDRQTQTDRHRETEKQTNTDREIQRERDRQTERQTDRETDTERQTDRERGRGKV